MELVAIKKTFRVDGGAPCPVIISDDNNLRLIFYGSENATEEERIIGLKFISVFYHSFGPPNGEALDGHPYYDLGLGQFDFCELLNSDLVEKLGKMGRFHPYYNPAAYNTKHHYIIPFKESVFECVSDSFEVSVQEATIYDRAVSIIYQPFKAN
ncbi:hypothetical protein [Mucilaginibacter gilvus]|uniref:Uncharacterized protein n=1 Tax=Mucilaginibacter gilvus TaxID=2305909 RepID=A0A3S3UTS7_9SPHI|nr:hypothetical protein [Mucilaginibacter gilvus]RWY54260.1 hypothetical protein EPL05_09505 [Mucilaginibacter gilvus]